MAEMRYYRVSVAPTIWDYSKTTFIKAHSPKDFLGYKVPNPKSEGFYLTVKNTKYFDGNVSYIRYNKITKEQYQAAQVADWIEKALAMRRVEESANAYLQVITQYFVNGFETRVEACALGLALIGKYGSWKEAEIAYKINYLEAAIHKTFEQFMAEELGVSEETVKRVDNSHICDISASEIARRLRNNIDMLLPVQP
jgi:hypothetical protein